MIYDRKIAYDHLRGLSETRRSVSKIGFLRHNFATQGNLSVCPNRHLDRVSIQSHLEIDPPLNRPTGLVGNIWLRCLLSRFVSKVLASRNIYGRQTIGLCLNPGFSNTKSLSHPCKTGNNAKIWERGFFEAFIVKNIISVTILYKINNNFKIFIRDTFELVNLSRCFKHIVTSYFPSPHKTA